MTNYFSNKWKFFLYVSFLAKVLLNEFLTALHPAGKKHKF